MQESSQSLLIGAAIREETVEPSFDIITWLRARRLKWVGEVLGEQEKPLQLHILRSYKKPYPAGSLLMDTYTAHHNNVTELEIMAADATYWASLVSKII